MIEDSKRPSEQTPAAVPDAEAALTSVLTEVAAFENALRTPAPQPVGGITEDMLTRFLYEGVGPEDAGDVFQWRLRITTMPLNRHTYWQHMAMHSNLLAFCDSPSLTTRVVCSMGRTAYRMADAATALDYYLSIPEPDPSDELATSWYVGALGEAARVYGSLGQADCIRALGKRILASDNETAKFDYYHALMECCAQQGRFEDVHTLAAEAERTFAEDSAEYEALLPIVKCLKRWEGNIIAVDAEFLELKMEQEYQHRMGLPTRQIDTRVAEKMNRVSQRHFSQK